MSRGVSRQDGGNGVVQFAEPVQYVIRPFVDELFQKRRVSQQRRHASRGRRESRETREAVRSGRFVRTGVRRHNLMDALPREAEQLADRVERFTVWTAFGPAPAAPEPENRRVSLSLRQRQ